MLAEIVARTLENDGARSSSDLVVITTDVDFGALPADSLAMIVALIDDDLALLCAECAGPLARGGGGGAAAARVLARRDPADATDSEIIRFELRSLVSQLWMSWSAPGVGPRGHQQGARDSALGYRAVRSRGLRPAHVCTAAVL